VSLHVEEPTSPRWLALWHDTGREPFAHPGFGGLFAGPADRCVAACWEDGSGSVLLPLVMRPLPPTLDGHNEIRGWVDGVSPYGYGGPFVSGTPSLTSFYEAFLQWMRDSRMLSCFVRGSVVGSAVPEVEPAGFRRVHLADNVVVGLGLPVEDRWRRYEHKVRKNVNKAKRHGMSTEINPDFTDVSAFVEVYGGTMARRSAAAFYRFDEAFFDRIRTVLEGNFWVADTRDEDGRVVSTELVLVGDSHCYSFLGGTRRDAFAGSPNDLLKHDVIDRAAEAGLNSYVLGGGYEPGDGIFRYKRSFDPTGVVPFWGAQLVADQGRYDAACSGTSEGEESFFPRYRAPTADD